MAEDLFVHDTLPLRVDETEAVRKELEGEKKKESQVH